MSTLRSSADPEARPQPMRMVILGLTITSSWGNGHATTFRALVRELARRGHDVLFLERDRPWYADNRDLPEPPYGRTALYESVEELIGRFGSAVRGADFVMVGSFVPDGVALAEWVTGQAAGITAFYDIDTPVTVAKLARGDTDYLSPRLVPRFDVYFSFTGGPLLRRIETSWGARRAVALYCSCDPDVHRPAPAPQRWDLGYLGTYSADRQPALERLMLEPARRRPRRRFVVAGPQYPDDIEWPRNTERIVHLAPAEHARFFAAQRFTLNLTRADMIEAGYSPSVRLFEAAACGTAIISDYWAGLDAFFEPGREILIAHRAEDTLRYLTEVPERERGRIGARARRRVLAEHTATHRAVELEAHILEAWARRRRARMAGPLPARARSRVPVA
jgi:spore maturation protein CgeB